MSLYPGERLAPTRSRETLGCIGCLICPRPVEVMVSTRAATEFRETADGVAPVQVEQGETGQSSCGLAAIHGRCGYDEQITELKDYIAEGGIDGVTLV